MPKVLMPIGNLVSAATWHDYGTKFFKVFIEKMRAWKG
jgi:hypothetical protein